jgi:hypothetical protein
MFYYAKAIFSTAVKLMVVVFYYPYYDMSQRNFEPSKRACILKKKPCSSVGADFVKHLRMSAEAILRTRFIALLKTCGL